MVETIVTGALSLIGAFAALYLLTSLFDRLPPKFEIRDRPLGAAKFGAWVSVMGLEVEEYNIGYTDGWEMGYSVSVSCEGQVSFGDDQSEATKTLFLRLRGDSGAYRKNDIIGWAEPRSDRMTVTLNLGPEQVRDIVSELRLNLKSHIHLQGFQAEKNILITYFSMTPKA